MQTHFSRFLNIRSPYVAPSESRRAELRHPSFAPISGLQMNLAQPRTNQPYGSCIPQHSRLHSSYVAQSLANQVNTRPTYIRPTTSLAFSRYEQAINPSAVNQPTNQFTYSRTPLKANKSTYIRPTSSAAFKRYEQAISPTAFTFSNSSIQSSASSYSIISAYATRSGNSSYSNMPVHEATPNLVRILSQYKKQPDGEQNVKTTAKLNFLIAVSRNWFLIRNKLKLPQSNDETKLKNELDSILKTAAACYKGKETGFADGTEQEMALIFNRLDDFLALMKTHNIRFSEECLNRFVESLAVEPTATLVPPAPPIPTQQDTQTLKTQADTSGKIKTDKYPQLDHLLKRYINAFKGSLKNDLNRSAYEITVDDRNIFSTASVFEPTLTAINQPPLVTKSKSIFTKLKFVKGSDSESSSDEEMSNGAARGSELKSETYIYMTKKQVLDKIKAACTPEQFNLVTLLACQNIVTFLLNYQNLLEEDGFENKTPIKHLRGLELGNVVRPNFDVHCDTNKQEVTITVSFNNHLISRDPVVADKVREIMAMFDDRLTFEEKELASRECQLDLSILINADGKLICQDIRIIQGKKIIDYTQNN